jgi:hypothetical protein
MPSWKAWLMRPIKREEVLALLGERTLNNAENVP